MMRVEAMVVITCGALLTVSCTSQSDPGSSGEGRNGAPSASTATLRGIPVASFSCDELQPDRAMQWRPFNNLETLLVCKGGAQRADPITVRASDTGFAELETALAAKDATGEADCAPVTPPLKTISFIAMADDEAYIVRIPEPLCGVIQPPLMDALEVAGIEVNRHTVGIP